MSRPSADSAIPSRRDFLKHSSALAVGGSVAASLGSVPVVHAQGSEAVNVALIGCGGRGSGRSPPAAPLHEHADRAL